MQVPPNSVVRLEWDSGSKPAPLATTIYQAAVDGKDQVTLKWWPREIADGYKITVSAAEGNRRTIDAGNKTEFTVHGLEPGKSFTFAVAAYNGNGSSGPSNEVSARMTAPDQPLIRHTYAKDEAVTVEWQSAANASGYRVCYGTMEAKADNCRDAGNVAGYTVTGLTNGSPYRFVVKAYNGAGESAASDSLTIAPQQDLPYSARNVLADKSSNGKVSLKWLPSKSAPADSYIIERSTSPFSGYQPIANGVSDTSYTDSSAEQGRVYSYRLFGVNDQGTSAYPSNVATVKSSSTISSP